MLKYAVRALRNPSTQEKKFYALCAPTSTLKLRDVIEQIETRCTVTAPDIKAVLNALETVVINAVKGGSAVRLGDLGSFRPTICSTGSATDAEVSAKNITKVRCRFTSSAEMNRKLNLLNLEFAPLVATATPSGPEDPGV